MLGLPLRSYLGARKVARLADDETPGCWSQDFPGRRVLVVGSGPSLDRVDEAFFEGFDTFLYINFALKQRKTHGAAYFFTTDFGPVGQFIDAFGDDAFKALGRDRCLFAPVFLDQYCYLTAEAHDLFTVLPCDAAGWRGQNVKIGPIKLPLAWRYYPRQPDWQTFRNAPRSRTLPVMDHTSALSAVLFAAQCGATDIGLIGCDFSAGRANFAVGTQGTIGAQAFAGAAGELQGMATAMARDGIAITNHSWLV